VAKAGYPRSRHGDTANDGHTGFHTTTYTAILYASVSLRMSPSKIIIIGILVQLAAVFSSILTPQWQKRRAWTNLAVLLRIVTLALILPLYACLGLVLPFGGLRTEAEMYVAATWFGLVCHCPIS
jgi:UMF1 family MFS transporter